jgi:hypothetical protein
MKKNSLTYLVYFAVTILAGFSFFSNYKNYVAFDKQTNIINVINSGRYEDLSKEYIKKISTGYPNLSATAIPLNTILGAHYINTDSLELGFEYLRKGNRDNPYIGFSDMVFANVYQSLGVRDSFIYYAREASRKLPNNPAHFALQGKIFLQEKQLDSFVNRFTEITSRVPDKEVWRLYLSAMVNKKYDLDTIEVNKNARKAKEIFPATQSLKLTADYVLYGEENVKKSIEFREKAIKIYESDPELSINLLKDAIKLVPDNTPYYETLIEMQFRVQDYEAVINLYDKLNEIKMTNLRGDIIEFISISYINTGNRSRGCYLANILNDVNYSIRPDVKVICRLP